MKSPWVEAAQQGECACDKPEQRHSGSFPQRGTEGVREGREDAFSERASQHRNLSGWHHGAIVPRNSVFAANYLATS